MLLDSNLIIYAASPDYGVLRELIAENQPSISLISKLEVLGYHSLVEREKSYFDPFFQEVVTIPF